MKPSILIIDDCESDRYLARRVVEESGLASSVVEFVDGREFVELLRDPDGFAQFRQSTAPPYLVILDLNMPLVDGFEVVEALEAWQAAHAGEARFAIMILTSSAHRADRDRADGYALVEGFLSKPLDAETLARFVEESF